MRKIMVMLLCFAMLTGSLSACSKGDSQGNSSSVEAAVTEAAATEVAEGATETPTEIEKVTEVPTETAVQAEESAPAEEEIVTAPISIDTSIQVMPGSRIAVIAKSTEGGYWRTMKSYMEEAVAYLNQEYGFEDDEKITMTFEGPKDEEDMTTQINIFDAVLAENPDVVCVSAIDMESCQAQLETAQENGIPVIVYDSGVLSDLVTATCLTDNRRLGRKAAKKLVKAMGGSGSVAVFGHESYTQSCTDRIKGFGNQIKRYDDVSIESVTYSNTDESMSEVIHNVLDSHTEITGIFCTCATVAEAVLTVLQDYPDREFEIVGVDMGSVQKKAISEGIEYGTVAQDIYSMAYEAIWIAAQTTAEEEVDIPSETKTSFIWVNAEYLSEHGQEENLYD